MDTEAKLAKNIVSLEKLFIQLPNVYNRRALAHTHRELFNDAIVLISRAREQILFSLGDEDEDARSRGFKFSLELITEWEEKLNRASTDDLIDTVDMAHLSALADDCKSHLKKFVRMT